jgi:hypothetical protein
MPELTSKEVETPIYTPSKEEQDLISAIWAKWNQANDQRQGSYRFFNDRTFIEYVNDSVDRFNGYKEPRTDPAADWGAKVFNNITRVKTIAIISQITAERVKAEFFAANHDDPEDVLVARIVKKLEESSYYKNRDDEQQFYSVLEAAVKGTAIGYEGYKVDKRKIKEITDYDPDTGKIKFKEKEIEDWNDVYGETIPIFDFYPGNIYVRQMQKQPFVIWRTVLDKDIFDAEFEKYPNFSKVQAQAGQMTTQEDDKNKQDSSSDFNTTSYTSESVRDGQVEVIRYFNKWTDEFHIVASGVLLTPMESPLPWDHKDYPFWKTIFEPFDGPFFYGKSLPDKAKDNQDVLNTLYRMALDQTALSINPPILTQGIENIKNEYLFPGARMNADDVNQTKVVPIPGVQPTHFQMIDKVESSLNRDSVSDQTSGQTGSRTTAYEVNVAKEASQKMLAIFLRTLEWSVRDKTELRVANILQFYRIPKISESLDGEEVMEYRKIVLDDTELADGTVGRQVVQVTSPDESLPSKEQITKAELHYLAKGQNVAFSFISTEKMRSFKTKIRIIPNSSIKMSEALNRALELDYQKTVLTYYPTMLNQEEGFRSLNEVFDKDANKMMSQQGQQPPQPGGEPPSAGPSMNTPNSASAAGVPTANSDANSLRNIPAA